MRLRLKWPQISLRLALVLYLVVPLVLVLSVASYVSLRSLEVQIEQRMQEDVELVARAIRLPLSHALERGHAGSVRQTLESAFRIDRVYGAYVYDAAGEKVASLGVEETMPERRRMAELAAEGDHTGEYGEIGGREVYSYFVPLTDSGGRIAGLLQVTRRGSDFREYVQTVRSRAGIAILVAGLILTGVVLYGHHGAIGKHLDRLGRSMARVEHGDRSHRAPLDGPKEIIQVGGALNTMLDSMDRAERQIEEQRRAQAALEERLRQAEKMAALGQLAAGVAHELGTPLSVVDGKAQRLLRRLEPDSGHRGNVQEIREEVRRMEHIVRQLLDFGRQHRPQRRRSSLERLANTAASAVKVEAQEAGVSLHVDGVRPCPRVPVDAIRMEQALVNLLRNAIQAAPRGRVELEWFRDGPEAGFKVRDDGPGVDPQAEPHLFEPFFTTKGVGSGTGLGLAVVHGIVEEHGGQIDVRPSALGGAEFVIRMDAGDDSPQKEDPDGNGGSAESGNLDPADSAIANGAGPGRRG